MDTLVMQLNDYKLVFGFEYSIFYLYTNNGLFLKELKIKTSRFWIFMQF